MRTRNLESLGSPCYGHGLVRGLVSIHISSKSSKSSNWLYNFGFKFYSNPHRIAGVGDGYKKHNLGPIYRYVVADFGEDQYQNN